MSKPPRGTTGRRLRDGVVLLSFPLPEGDNLTESELEILQHIFRGASNREIARSRGTSLHTVANQIGALLKKCGAASRADLALRWLDLLSRPN